MNITIYGWSGRPAAMAEIEEIAPRRSGAAIHLGGHVGTYDRPPAQRPCLHRAGGRPSGRRELQGPDLVPGHEAAGIRRFPPRIMRHTAANWLVIDGVPLYDVQALLGHESYRTTERYAHLAPDAHDKVVQSWARRHEAPVTHERKQGRLS
jgi:integrase